jgi:hypothetical protein
LYRNSAQAVQSCAFTLLLDIIDEVKSKKAIAMESLQRIRDNLYVQDSKLLTDEMKSSTASNKKLSDVFPNLSNGFSAIVGNPRISVSHIYHL